MIIDHDVQAQVVSRHTTTSFRTGKTKVREETNPLPLQEGRVYPVLEEQGDQITLIIWDPTEVTKWTRTHYYATATLPKSAVYQGTMVYAVEVEEGYEETAWVVRDIYTTQASAEREAERIRAEYGHAEDKRVIVTPYRLKE